MSTLIIRTLVVAASIMSFGIALSAKAQDDAVAGAVALGGIGVVSIIWMFWMVFVFTMMLVNLAGMIFWIIMIVDVAKRTFKTESDKTLWILVVVLAGWIGALIYYFTVKRKEDAINENKK